MNKHIDSMASTAHVTRASLRGTRSLFRTLGERHPVARGRAWRSSSLGRKQHVEPSAAGPRLPGAVRTGRETGGVVVAFSLAPYTEAPPPPAADDKSHPSHFPRSAQMMF